MQEKYQNKYRIKSARAIWHDYNGGAYFITICIQNRGHYFGEIKNGIMYLSDIGVCANTNLQNINTHYPYAEIPLFVVMPNHIHAIVFINRDYGRHYRDNENCRNVNSGDLANSGNVDCRDVACNVSSTSPPTDVADRGGDVARNVSTNMVKQTKNKKMVEIAKYQSLLCVTMRGFKSAVTKFAHNKNIDFIWQTRFHDHIIRDQKEMNRIAYYIENNPATWNKDCYNKNDNTPPSSS
jgi:REP element-mobilizing transposase RayT